MKTKTLHVVHTGGIGDALLVTPTLRELKRRYPARKLVVHTSCDEHRDIFKGNPNIDHLTIDSNAKVLLANILRRYGLLRLDIVFTNYGRIGPSLLFGRHTRHAVDLVAQMFDLELRDSRLEVFLTEEEEAMARRTLAGYETPVIIHTTPLCSINKEWPIESWTALLRRNPGMTFLQVGLKAEPLVLGAIDLRGKGTLRSRLALIKYGAAFVGVESSLAHATNAFGTRGVVLFGPSSPEVWGHPNNINIYRRPRCSPCLDLLGGPYQCPYGRACMAQITVEEVEAALRQQVAITRSAPVCR